VAPDSEGNNWMPVYIHSKLMIINDVFTTHGSANINTRSMQVDSEMNIAHCNAPTTKAMRKKLWSLHTKKLGGKDDPEEEFNTWSDLIIRNKTRQTGRYKEKPLCSIVEFNYSKPKSSNMD
jgi:phosphatidylserine/phosphatidylglycerophosphate/cardiolipin synthase-like enzyme